MAERNLHVFRLVTSGMRDLPMTTPEDPDIPRYAERLITLPADWRLDQESLKDEAWYWPLQGLRRWFLATRDAHGLYEKFGFTPLKRPEIFMERHNPNAYGARS